MRTRLFFLIVCGLLVMGCAASGPEASETETESVAWPRVAVEMRLLKVNEAFLEEFGIEFEVLTEPAGLAADGVFVVPIDEVRESLLVTATLAQQNSISRTLTRQMLVPGEAGQVWMEPGVSFINDLGQEHLQVEGGILFEVVAEPTVPGGPEAPLRVVLVARALPEGVRHGEELGWVERRGAGGIVVYPGPTFRVQAVCAGGATYLAALPAPGPDAQDNRRTLLLFRATLVASPAAEAALFPGLVRDE